MVDNDKFIFPLPKDLWESERERIFHNSVRYFNDKIEKNEEFKQMIRERFIKRNSDLEMY